MLFVIRGAFDVRVQRGLVCPLKPICFMVGDSSGMAVAKVNLPAGVLATELSGVFFPHGKSVYHAWRLEMMMMMKLLNDRVSCSLGWPPTSSVSKDAFNF